MPYLCQSCVTGLCRRTVLELCHRAMWQTCVRTASQGYEADLCQSSVTGLCGRPVSELRHRPMWQTCVAAVTFQVLFLYVTSHIAESQPFLTELSHRFGSHTGENWRILSQHKPIQWFHNENTSVNNMKV